MTSSGNQKRWAKIVMQSSLTGSNVSDLVCQIDRVMWILTYSSGRDTMFTGENAGSPE